MSIFSFTGQDTFTINGRVITDLADGDCVVVEYPNDLMNVKIGKNNNAIFGQNATGELANVKARIVRGSPDDKFLNGLLAQQQVSPETFILLTGELVKNIGDGTSGTNGDITAFSGGIFGKKPMVKTNVEGDPTQAVTEYSFVFAKGQRVIS